MSLSVNIIYETNIKEAKIMNPKYSASRIGTYHSCLQKYKLSYVDELVVLGREYDVQEKGLVFHKIAEETQPGESLESVTERALKAIETANFDKEKYPLEKAIPVFYYWWQEYVEKYLAQGFEIFKEEWKNAEIDGTPLCGAIDVLMVNKETKEVRIYDYKTGSKAHLDGYENQLMLYTWMMAKELGIPDEELTQKIKCYLFYPIAGVKTFDVSDEKKIEKYALKNTLQLSYTVNDIHSFIDSLKDIIRDTNERDWQNLDPIVNSEIGFSCSFCAFCGHPTYCPATYKADLRFPRSARVVTKEEAKKIAEAEKEKEAQAQA